MCLGRHPLQNPSMIKPKIGKLPKSVVERIPLVMYIPPPPDAPETGPIAPEAIYSYPPNSPGVPPLPPKRRRFKFLRRASQKKATARADKPLKEELAKTASITEPQSWEDHWEQEGYPFVVLEANRAACSICLCDFEEPKRRGVAEEARAVEAEVPASDPLPSSSRDQAVQTVPVEDITEAEQEKQLKLEDSGEGAQPLRLLACGHVFHVSAINREAWESLLMRYLNQKTCLDPWLTDVSGRCPVCQRAVELPNPQKKKKGRSLDDHGD